MNQAKHARIVLKARKLRLFMKMMRKLGDSRFKNDSALANFLDYTKGYVSQITSQMHIAKNGDRIPVTGEFAATVMYLINVPFHIFFDIDPTPEYDPKEKYKKFRRRT